MIDISVFLAILPEPPTGVPPGEVAATGIRFFSLWILRLGGIVAFIGAVKFALSIKTEDLREQIQAILVMVSGFMIMSAVGNLDLFTFGTEGAEAEFQAIMGFIGGWVRRVGALAFMIGAITFALAMRDNNADKKVNGLKTIAAGGITVSLSAILPLFV